MDLQRLLDKSKTAVFGTTNAAFFGPLMCNLSFEWSDKVERAGTNGKQVLLNSDWFVSMSEEVRKSVIVHEIDHVARLHMIRKGDRDHQLWNIACDMVINRWMVNERFTFEGESHIQCPDEYKDLCEEEIYDKLLEDAENSKSLGDPDDLMAGDDEGGSLSPLDKATIIGNVMTAVHAAKMSDKTGNMTGTYEEIIKSLTVVKVDWKEKLQNRLTEKSMKQTSWKRRNRNFKEIYIPGKIEEDGALDSVVFFQDCSGSVDSQELAQANAEAQFIKQTFRPKSMKIIQFDTSITNIIEVDESNELEELKIVGRGGTSLREVHKYIEDNQPNLVVIFSDLECQPMDPINQKTEVIWVVVRSGITPPFGDYVHI